MKKKRQQWEISEEKYPERVRLSFSAKRKLEDLQKTKRFDRWKLSEIVSHIIEKFKW